jgi:hypothetical protein
MNLPVIQEVVMWSEGEWRQNNGGGRVSRVVLKGGGSGVESGGSGVEQEGGESEVE